MQATVSVPPLGFAFDLAPICRAALLPPLERHDLLGLLALPEYCRKEAAFGVYSQHLEKAVSSS